MHPLQFRLRGSDSSQAKLFGSVPLVFFAGGFSEQQDLTVPVKMEKLPEQRPLEVCDVEEIVRGPEVYEPYDPDNTMNTLPPSGTPSPIPEEIGDVSLVDSADIESGDESLVDVARTVSGSKDNPIVIQSPTSTGSEPSENQPYKCSKRCARLGLAHRSCSRCPLAAAA